ncbi:YfiR family protein [Sphingobium lignivorans]|uniref:DUF4154 domain-containing protein n=1 Tax=Sphingobium lignivorans TaxID=2735886 RepID=A0ABR6NDX5_9SPHN|nr:YfiR family protein [Sphingobium lignivorans]MBB5985441.1 hypothetical protein [Sphingobium lignivorans]
MKRFLPPLQPFGLGIAALALTAIPSSAHAATEPPHLKAAIIYNIIRFVDLRPPSGRVVLCVPGNEPLADALQVYDGRNVAGGRLEVRVVKRTAWSVDCRIAYVAPGSAGPAGNAPPPATLLIGEGSDFLDRQGSVAIVSFGRQIGFEVNLTAGARAGAVFSSRLLRLARAVKD